MSLLTDPEPFGPWVPAGLAASDYAAFSALVVYLAARVRSAKDPEKAMIRACLDARDHLGRRLDEGRYEAAEVRTALGLPMTATIPEVVAAIRSLSPSSDRAERVSGD